MALFTFALVVAVAAAASLDLHQLLGGSVLLGSPERVHAALLPLFLFVSAAHVLRLVFMFMGSGKRLFILLLALAYTMRANYLFAEWH